MKGIEEDERIIRIINAEETQCISCEQHLVKGCLTHVHICAGETDEMPMQEYYFDPKKNQSFIRVFYPVSKNCQFFIQDQKTDSWKEIQYERQTNT